MMKVRESVLVLSLCLIVVVAVLGVLCRLTANQDSWRPSDIYDNVGGSVYSSVSETSGASDEVLVPVRGGMRSSRRYVAAPVSSYARSEHNVGLSGESNLPSLQGGAGVGPLYTISSRMAKSFGSGFASGAATSSSVTRNSEQIVQKSQTALSVDASQLTGVYAYSYIPMSSAVSAVGANAAPSLRPASAPRRVPGAGDAWDNWLDSLGSGEGFLYWDEFGNRYYDLDLLKDAFEDAKQNGQLPGWDWDDFLAQFFDPSTKHNVPLGEAWVLLVMAFGYMGYLFVRSARARKASTTV